jgi:hypothetical protein
MRIGAKFDVEKFVRVRGIAVSRMLGLEMQDVCEVVLDNGRYSLELHFRLNSYAAPGGVEGLGWPLRLFLSLF